MGGPAQEAAAPLPARPLVASSATLGVADTQPEIAAVAAGALRRLADCVQLTDVQVQLRDAAPAWQALRAAHPQRQQIEAARSRRRDNDDALHRPFGRVDLVAPPNLPHGHNGPDTAMSVALTWAFNLSGHPAISIAAGFTPAGAPVSVQLVARPEADQLLVAVASDAQHRLGSTGPARQW